MNISELTDSGTNEASPLQFVRRISYSLFCILGILGNGIVCFAGIRTKRFRSSSGLFLLNLAVSDILVVLLYLPIDLVYIEIYHWVWPLGTTMCKLVTTLADLSVTVSGTTLVAISFDRQRHIMNPLVLPFSLLFTSIIIAAIWVYSALTLLPFAMSLEVLPNGECGNNIDFWESQVSLQLQHVFLLFTPQIVIPLTLIFIAYVTIFNYLKRYRRNLAQRPTEDFHRLASFRAKQNAKTMKILTALILVYIICILPYQVLVIIIVFNQHLMNNFTIRQVHEFTRLLVSANSCCNPLLYGGLSKEIKHKLRKLFKLNRVRPERGIIENHHPHMHCKTAPVSTNQHVLKNLFPFPMNNL